VNGGMSDDRLPPVDKLLEPSHTLFLFKRGKRKPSRIMTAPADQKAALERALTVMAQDGFARVLGRYNAGGGYYEPVDAFTVRVRECGGLW
jgi:hypothetical protein